MARIDIRLLLIIFILILSVFVGRNIAQLSFDAGLLLIVGLIAATITLFNTDLGLFIIILSMLLSPEIKTGAIPGRDVVLRFEDFLIIIVVFSWLAKTAVHKGLGLFRKTPLNLPIGIYISVCIVLTLRGMMLGHVLPLKGFFYVLKYIEYFLLYFMVVNQIQRKAQIKMFIIAFLITCAITCTYANLHIGTTSRLSAPFEGEGEPNTLGGYLMFMLAIIMGIFLYSTSFRAKFWLGGMSLFLILPAFLFTLSRTSYIAIVPMWIGLIIFGPRKAMLTIILLLSMVLGLFFMPGPVRKRIEYTFTGEVTPGEAVVIIAGKKLDPSFSDRITSWQERIDRWKVSPLLGYGVTGAGFIDGQYVCTLAEMGLLGLSIFLILLWSIFKHSRENFLKIEDRFFKGLSLGFLAGFIGIIVFNGGANGFIITRIMEPFWFMAAIVMLLPEIEIEEKRKLSQLCCKHFL